MLGEDEALTVADLCSDQNSNGVHHFDEFSDHSTIGYTDDEEDDDSFLANNSLCKQHKSAMKMLDSLRKEVVQMARSDGKFETRPKKSPRDVMIDINGDNDDLSSPLGSPTLLRKTVSLSHTTPSVPTMAQRNNSACVLKVSTHSDDSTLCSLDNSIDHEMSALKEVAKDLETELREANINSVFGAIERMGNSDDPAIKNVLESEDKEVLREGIRKELESYELAQQPHRRFLDYMETFEGGSMNLKVLIAAVVFALMQRHFFSGGQE